MGRRTLSGLLGALAATACLSAAGAAVASDSCIEWKREHAQWMTEAVRLYLRAAPQAELDAALFELLQREAYMTSCDVSVRAARGELVGWRLVDRSPDEYGSAVLETVLACSGFDLDLRALFEREIAVAEPAPVRARYGPAARAR